MDRTDKAIAILKNQGVKTIRLTRDDYGGALLYTDGGYYFVKNDIRPWFRPPDFKGVGLAVNARSFEKYIKPNNAHFIYSWGEREEMFIVPIGQFLNNVRVREQPDGTKAYVYPLSESHPFGKVKVTPPTSLDDYQT